MKKTSYIIAIMGIISLFFTGCSNKDDDSSSSSTEVSAISGSDSIALSSKVSVVEPKTSDSTARTANAIATSGFSATAEYNTDDTTTYVYEESAESLNLVNEILCQITQGRPDLMMNAGNYKAQIDGNKCGTMTGDSQSNAPSYDMWTINATRTEGQPMEIKAWVPQDDGYINANMSVSQPPSTDYPLGFFEMNFKAVAADGTESMKGYMNTTAISGGNALEFYNPMEIEQTMQSASSASVCTDAGLSFGDVSLPDSSKWIDPDIGDIPTVTGPPSVVSGDKTGS